MYDLIVIGGGPGGYLAAERAAQKGLKVLLFEKRALGGVCLNEGCIPSKALLNSAKLYQHALHGASYGVTCADTRLDQEAVIDRKNRVVRTLVGGIRGKLRAKGVQVIQEEAYIQAKTADGFDLSAAGQSYTGKRLLIATGSSPVVPPIPGVREHLGSFVLTSREILDLTEVPAQLAVIGGGVIGLEMAAYYAAAGSKVTVIEMLDHIAGATDRQISALLQKELTHLGITFLLGHKCLSVQPGQVLVQSPEGNALTVAADKVLLSIGRRANTQGLGLENIGVNFTETGISTDTQCRTNIDGVYAVGDVNGHHMLAHTAYREAEVAVNHMLGRPDVMRYHANPSVIYTQPEVASVGRTEEECREKGIDYEVRSLPLGYAGRFVAENDETAGLCKVIADKKRRTVIGIHLIGPYASEIIWGAAQMLEMQLRIADARQIIFPHPTLSEILREVLWEFDD